MEVVDGDSLQVNNVLGRSKSSHECVCGNETNFLQMFLGVPEHRSQAYFHVSCLSAPQAHQTMVVRCGPVLFNVKVPIDYLDHL